MAERGSRFSLKNLRASLRRGKRQSHRPASSIEVTHTDGGSKVTHRDGGSKVTHRDGGSKVTHRDGRSKVTHTDRGSKVTHTDGGSKLTHTHRGPKLTHTDRGSKLNRSSSVRQGQVGGVNSVGRARPQSAYYIKPAQVEWTAASAWNKPLLGRAIRPFRAILRCDLTFDLGDEILILTRTGKQFDWWEGSVDGRTGIFPANYIRVME